MKAYIHKVNYYETDKMGITHHSNYVRWMEEARIDFLDQLGWSFIKLEEEGIIRYTGKAIEVLNQDELQLVLNDHPD